MTSGWFHLEGETMTTPDTSTLTRDQRARAQEAQVQDNEAKARKAAADAAMSELTFTQARYKALVPDLTGVATNAVADKSAGVAFSGLVTHSALNHAAEVIANRIATVLTGPEEGQPVILVTSQTDLLTNDLLSTTVDAWLQQVLDFADKVLALTEPQHLPAIFRIADQAPPWRHFSLSQDLRPDADFLGPTAGVLTATGLGPVGLAAAAAAAVPSIISLFSSTTTVKDHSEDITDLTTTTSVLAAVGSRPAADKLGGYRFVHEDFRLAPTKSRILEKYGELADRRSKLIFKQLELQTIKNKNELGLDVADGVETDDAAGESGAAKPDRAAREPRRVRVDLAAGERGAAEADSAAGKHDRPEEIIATVQPGVDAQLSVISGAITSIDTFTTAVNATAAGGRSPLAIASLNELLHKGGVDGISHVLSVKVLGGRSEQYTKDRRVGFDTYTTLADASVSFMLYDVAHQKIIKSGIANGVSSVHGRLGKPPPDAADAIKELAADASPTNQSGRTPEPRKKRWRLWSWRIRHIR